MRAHMKKLEQLLELGGIRKDVTLLVISGIAVVLSLLGIRPSPFDMAWIAIILCGIPIILEAVIGLVTAFDIKADVLAVSYTHLDVYKRQGWNRSPRSPSDSPGAACG